MSLIISQDREISTDAVMEYIHYHGGRVKRYNHESGIKDITISIDNFNGSFHFSSSGEVAYSSDNFDGFWYRRGAFSYITPINKMDTPNDIKEFINDEWSVINAFLFNENPFLGSYAHETYNNKLTNLSTAVCRQTNLDTC
jgi:hypothetical protein